MSEEWRSVPGYEGLYEVSNIGRVKSLPGGRRKGDCLKLAIRDGYYACSLHKEHGCITCDCERSYQTYLEVHQSDTKSLACYVSSLNSRAIPFLELADTTTKALLKLTLALLEAGINLKEPSDV